MTLDESWSASWATSSTGHRPPATGPVGLEGGSSADVIVLDGHGQRGDEHGSGGMAPSGDVAGDARPVGEFPPPHLESEGA
jgi:hypothetical protein